jgi:hypothetical protein
VQDTANADVEVNEINARNKRSHVFLPDYFFWKQSLVAKCGRGVKVSELCRSAQARLGVRLPVVAVLEPICGVLLSVLYVAVAIAGTGIVALRAHTARGALSGTPVALNAVRKSSSHAQMRAYGGRKQQGE